MAMMTWGQHELGTSLLPNLTSDQEERGNDEGWEEEQQKQEIGQQYRWADSVSDEDNQATELDVALLDRGESNKAIILVDNDTNSIDIGGPLEDENVRV